MTSNYGRQPTHPLSHAARKKPRRWPLVLRFYKGAIHPVIILPVLLHAAFAALIVYFARNVHFKVGFLPGTFIPSLSIVVGLMLVFRNQTSFDRFWQGRNHLTTACTAVRNLTRSFLAWSYSSGAGQGPTESERADVEMTIRALLAILYALKHHLRAEWRSAIVTPSQSTIFPNPSIGFAKSTTEIGGHAEYADLLPPGMQDFEDRGLSVPLQLTYYVESYIKRAYDRKWFHAPGSSQLSVQLNNLVDSLGRMETIRLTPVPIAHVIHAKQVLATFGAVLPFAMVDDLGWWTPLLVVLLTFTLYGIEGIGVQLEDPFGYDTIDINVGAVVEDTRDEVTVMLDEWRRAGAKGMFQRN